MIQSYKDRDVKRLYDGEDVPKWSPIRRQAERRLRILDAADSLESLMLLPSNHFEALRGDRLGWYSIRVNLRWRLCFVWPAGADGPGEVQIIDYH